MKKIFKYLIIVLLSFLIVGCEDKNSSESELDTLKSLTTIEVKCNENWFFSKYDLNVFVDDDRIGFVEHGKTEKFEVELTDGKHAFKVENNEDDGVKGTATFNVEGYTQVKFELNCHNDEISIISTLEVKPPIDKESALKLTYKDAKELFEKAGFTTIEERAIKDLSEADINNNKIVTDIEIDGSNTFSKDDKYSPDVKVIIEYHTMKDIEMKDDSESYIGKKESEVEKIFKKYGFKNIKKEETENTTYYYKGTVLDVKIKNSSFEKGDAFSPDDEVLIKYAGETKKEEENNTNEKEVLDTYYMKKAFENYGNSKYPYGFKVDWGRYINIEKQSNTKYFVKVPVTITNAFGADRRTIAEAIVYGTNKEVYVKNFVVSK